MPIFTQSPSIFVTLIWMSSPMTIPSFSFLVNISILNAFVSLSYSVWFSGFRDVPVEALWGEPVTRHDRSRFALIVIQSVTVKSKNLFRKNPVIVLFTAPKRPFFRNNLKENPAHAVQQNSVVFFSCHAPHFPCKTLDSFKE